MAANTLPIFIKQGNFTPVRITAANIYPDLGTSTTGCVLLVTGGTDGTRVDGVRFRNTATTQTATSTTMVHRVYLVTGALSSANAKLVGEVVTATATRSASVIGATSIITFDQPIIMVTGQTLYVSQSSVAAAAGDQFDACAFAGNY
jgi:hypothetical protein